MSRTTRQRECIRCGDFYEEPQPWPYDWPKNYCSKACSRKIVSSGSATVRKPVSVASPEQRTFVAGQPCLVDASHEGKVHPAHLIPRGLLTEGQEDARAVVPLCPLCHRLYDTGELDLLGHLEPRFRVELAFAVERFGLVSTLRRVTNERAPVEREERTAC